MAKPTGSKLLHRSQGRARPVVVRIDEMTAGVPDSGAPKDDGKASEASRAMREGDDAARREAASLLGKLGGIAKAERDRGLRVLEGLGLRGIPNEVLAPFLSDAEAFAVHEMKRLAAEVGGGICNVGPSSIVQSAALQLAGSRCAFATGELLVGSRLADASRANLISARELCAREAAARPKPNTLSWLTDPAQTAPKAKKPADVTPDGETSAAGNLDASEVGDA